MGNKGYSRGAHEVLEAVLAGTRRGLKCLPVFSVVSKCIGKQPPSPALCCTVSGGSHLGPFPLRPRSHLGIAALFVGWLVRLICARAWAAPAPYPASTLESEYPVSTLGVPALGRTCTFIVSRDPRASHGACVNAEEHCCNHP